MPTMWLPDGTPIQVPGNEYWDQNNNPEWLYNQPQQQVQAPAPAPAPATVPAAAGSPSAAQGPTPQDLMFNPGGPIYEGNPLFQGMGWGPGPGATMPLPQQQGPQMPGAQMPGLDMQALMAMAGFTGAPGPSPFGSMFGDYGAFMPWGEYITPNWYDPNSGQFSQPLVPGTPHAPWANLPQFNPVYGGGQLPNPLELYSELKNLNPRVGRTNSGTITK